MRRSIKKFFALSGMAMVVMVSQPVWADGGWGRHHGGHGSGRSWVPFALGAVVGGVAVGAMMQPAPVVAQPVYPPPPPGYYYGPPRMMPPPVYMVPPPPPVVYGY